MFLCMYTYTYAHTHRYIYMHIYNLTQLVIIWNKYRPYFNKVLFRGDNSNYLTIRVRQRERVCLINENKYWSVCGIKAY